MTPPTLWDSVRPSDPETSHDAAGTTNRQQGRAMVLEALRGSDGLTDEQIADLAGMDKGSAAKRRLDLVRAGRVVWTGRHGLTSNGCKARTWRLT